MAGAALGSAAASLVERAERLFPGGVNSPVRAFRAVGARGFAKVVEETGSRRDNSCIRGYGLHDHRRDPAGMLGKREPDRCQIVVRQHDGGRCDCAWHPRAARDG